MCDLGFPGGTSGKEPTCQCKRHKGHRFDPWDGKISRRRAWQPTPVFLPGESPWQATSHGVARSQTQLKQLSTQHTQKYKTLCLRRELSELCEYLSHSPSPQTASALWRRPLFAESFCWFPWTASPFHTNLQVANFQSWERAPVCQLLCWTTVLSKVL